DFSEVWEHALEKLLKQSALKQEEAAILSQFGKNLGNHTFLQQEKHIHLKMHQLKEIINNAIDEQHKYERMAKTQREITCIYNELSVNFISNCRHSHYYRIDPYRIKTSRQRGYCPVRFISRFYYSTCYCDPSFK